MTVTSVVVVSASYGWPVCMYVCMFVCVCVCTHALKRFRHTAADDLLSDINVMSYVFEFRVQAGKYKDGLGLAEECIDMVENFPDQFEKEERNEKLMYLYGHIARIKSLVSHFVLIIIICFKVEQV